MQVARLEGVKVIYIFDNMLPTPAIKLFSTLTALIVWGLGFAQEPNLNLAKTDLSLEPKEPKYIVNKENAALVKLNTTCSNNILHYRPEQDCFGAIPICTPNYINTVKYFWEGSLPNEINPYSSLCGTLSEKDGAWFKIYINQPGLLGFTIFPNDSADDYDWALFDLTNSNCYDIYNVDTLQVACNFSGATGPTGANGTTSITCTNKINVLQGQVYYLYISFFADYNFAGTDSVVNPVNQSLYAIDFSISSCSIDSCLEQTLTSVSENSNLVDITTYPNPAKSNITISLPYIQGQADMRIYNTAGQLVKTVTNIKQENTVDISNLATGLYYYRILTTDGKTAAGMFVKE